MSETATLSSSDIRSWLQNETSSIFVPVHTKAQKLISDVEKSLEDLSQVSKMLLDNSGKEIEKRNMKTYGRARALNKLSRLFIDRMRQIKVSDEVTYDSFQSLVQEIQRAFTVTEVDIRNYFPRISPFFILDRRKFLAIFEKAKELLKELQSFQTKEYVKTKTLEQTFQLIDRIQVLEQQFAGLKEQKIETESEKTALEKEISEIRQKMVDSRSKGTMSQLDHINKEIETLNAEVRHSLQHLQKPFIKLQALSLHGGGSGLTQDEVKKLNWYLENPLEAFAQETSGYPRLKQILEKLKRLMSEGKLKLKADKERKAEQAIENILHKNSLTALHQRCANVMTQKKQLSASNDLAEIKSDLSKLQEQLEKSQKKKETVQSQEKTTEEAQKETLEKIRNTKNEVEKNIFSFLGKNVRIQ